MARKKILTISDHPLSTSGVAHSMRNVITSLLETDEYDIISLGGAQKHREYQPQRTQEWGDRWTIYPVDGFGTQDIIRQVLKEQKPDLLLFQSDPRFFIWLLQIENEIRQNVPMMWYGIWDNYPYPQYNKPIWGSVDVFCSISKVTHDLVNNVTPNTKNIRIPHTVDDRIYKKLPYEIVDKFKNDHLANVKNRFIIFWNNRNARRKQPGTLLYYFNKFLDRVGRDKAFLLMHTNPMDSVGQNLIEISRDLGLDHNQVQFSSNKLSPNHLSLMYNCADVTVNIADAEGFGYSTLESLSCGTPIIVSMTGGLQEQVTNGEEWFGIGLEPSAKCVVGSQDIPYIFEDHVSGEDFINALEKMYNMSNLEREKMGLRGMEYVKKDYNFTKWHNYWKDLVKQTIEEFGSWPNKKYQKYTLEEI